MFSKHSAETLPSNLAAHRSIHRYLLTEVLPRQHLRHRPFLHHFSLRILQQLAICCSHQVVAVLWNQLGRVLFWPPVVSMQHRRLARRRQTVNRIFVFLSPLQHKISSNPTALTILALGSF